ncbi:cytochrome c551 [Lederbergia citrea]|uniref:Cytochrome c n=1 Tax=Lederbergia citrea TaxID=2833581 RepID=A0A942USF7_9BACI|nr:cytochrome c [Lederbergia citrea]MBS4223159.1 cytochrome c [Lederbergia citrea]
MKKKFFTLLMGAALTLGLAACGGGNNADNNNNAGKTTANDPEAIVKQNCTSCHGDNLEGRNGPALAHIGAELSKDEILDAIENGRGGMPAGIIKGDDAEKVAAWLSEKK